MDYPTAPCKSPGDELQRLSTFGRNPIPRGMCSGIINSPSKFVAAYFERKDGAVGDEVFCKSCGVTFFSWKGENPVVVHRSISSKCPALNTPPVGGDVLQSQAFLETLQQNPYKEYLPSNVQPQLGSETPSQIEVPSSSCVRRQLFMSPGLHEGRSSGNAEPEGCMQTPLHPSVVSGSSSASSVLMRPIIKHPFKPITGQYDDLFASWRMKSYPSTHATRQNQEWAEEGFVFLGEGHVQCAFCGSTAVRNGLHPHTVHIKINPSCPFLIGTDLGNVSCKQELDIRMKYLEQQHSKTVPISCVIHPHYANDKVRKDTFTNWPRMCSPVFPAELMCSAGFYYSGCTDKVVCFSCGIQLYNWIPEADPWQHHAKLSPTCKFVVDHRDQDFIQQAAEIEVKTDVKLPGIGSSQSVQLTDSGAVVATEIGSSTLDQAAVTAALACRFPNEAILLPALKAWDENHVTLCEQQWQIYQIRQEKDTELQTVIQEKDTELQTVIQEKDTELQTVIQEKDIQYQTQLQRVIQEKQVLQQVAQEKDVQIAQRDAQITQQAAELHHKEGQLQMQDQQIQSLMQMVQQLRADRRPPNPVVPGPDGDGALPVDNESQQRLLCKICLSEESNMIFLPCGHVTSCIRCASRLPDKRCPVCRRDIADILPAFVV